VIPFFDIWTIPEFCLSQETRPASATSRTALKSFTRPARSISQRKSTERMLYVDLDILMTRQPTQHRGCGEVAAAKKNPPARRDAYQAQAATDGPPCHRRGSGAFED
jgi:hypothetical protein